MSGVNGSLNGQATEGASFVARADTEVSLVRAQQDRTIQVLPSADLANFMPLLNIEQAIARRVFIVRATQELMQKEVDYGTIPGTNKPTLLQPGADKLCNLFGIVIQYDFLEKVEDWTGEHHGNEPFFYYQVRARGYRGEFLMGEGIGSCSSWEAKYRYRNAERTCPSCGKANIRKSSREGGWYCWKKTDGCGAQFPEDSAPILSQTVGKKLNPDVTDTVNTILKMAYKRAKVSATINATSASEFFTQDVEDFTVPDSIDTGGYPMGTSRAAQHVAQEKLASGNVGATRPWRSTREMGKMFEAIREAAGEVAYRGELERYGFENFQAIIRAIDNKKPNAHEKAIEIYRHLEVIARKDVA